MARSNPALPSAVGILLEPSRPTEARPLPTPSACGSFTSYNSGAHPAFPSQGSVPAASLPAWAWGLPSSPLTLVPDLGPQGSHLGFTCHDPRLPGQACPRCLCPGLAHFSPSADTLALPSLFLAPTSGAGG